MAKLSSTTPFLLIGKPVKDEYGRQIGQVASFMVNPNGRVNGIFIKHWDGEFSRHPSNQFKIHDDGVVLLSRIKSRVRTLCNEIPLIWRKDQALSELLEKKKIPSEMSNGLHKNFENALNELKADAQTTLDNIDEQVAKCAQQIRELNLGMVYLEIEREIGKMDEKLYQMATEMIRGGLKWAEAEKSDLEAMRNRLSNILLGEAPTTTTQMETKKEAVSAPAPPKLPEPPVAVRVKSPNKPGS